jgi:FAD/FMN-containing dehydrogenase
MNRRDFLECAVTALVPVPRLQAQSSRTALAPRTIRRVRPGDAGWPSAATWNELRAQVAGRLLTLESPLRGCEQRPAPSSCVDVLQQLNNPYYLGDEPALTQTSGWLKAWTSVPSVYAVSAQTTADVVAAVNFARQHRLRLVVKGGGDSYQGTSCAPDSLLIWTRGMNEIELHSAFTAVGDRSGHTQPAVSIGAGAIWMHVYNRVTTVAGRYVQGGGCTTVGVAGLIQSGGFGSFSKRFGLAAAGLLEAEVVTAEGAVRVVSSSSDPDLFWALKGGGGGSFGVVTRVTLRTHDLPTFVGGTFGVLRAPSDAAYRELVSRLIAFYRQRLFTPHWGEQIRFRRDNAVDIRMTFSGLGQEEAEATWRPLLEWLGSSPRGYQWLEPWTIIALPARRFWDPAFFKDQAPQFVSFDRRTDAPPGNMMWAGDQEEAGQFLYAYRSTWLAESLLSDGNQNALVEAIVAASRHWDLSLHFNKGLAGARPEERAEARNTPINPAAVDAFALAIVAGHGPPAYMGMPGGLPDEGVASDAALRIGLAMDALMAVVDRPASYVAESNFFERNWSEACWGSNFPRLAAVKKRYDPDGLFVVHNGVGSDDWTDDGFRRR